MNLPVPIRMLDPSLPLPTRQRDGDLGYDLVARETTTIEPSGQASIPTGVSLALPDGVAGLVLPRSGLAQEHGLSIVNTPGLIDPNYRGEIHVLAVMHGKRPLTIERGQRCAQLLLVPTLVANWIPTDQLGESARGTGGFGSSGR